VCRARREGGLADTRHSRQADHHTGAGTDRPVGEQIPQLLELLAAADEV
jgi:hypothetical protein